MAIVDIGAFYNIKPVSLSEIAIRQNIAVNYLEQIFFKLKNIGVVTAVRGPGGGYKLNVEPSKLKVATVISAVEESIKMTRCTREEHVSCTRTNVRCNTHFLWQGLENKIEDYFNSISIADILDGRI